MTTIPACKAAILAILAARAALTGVTMSWAGPTKDEDFAGELIYLGRTERSSTWAELGQGRRVEEYAIELTVFVEQFGDDPQTVEQRAYTLLDEVEDALRDDIRTPASTLRAAGVLQFNDMTDTSATGPASPDKWGARIDAAAQFQARNI